MGDIRVENAGLAKAAASLRDEVVQPLKVAASSVDRGLPAGPLTFDIYTTAAPYQAAAVAWRNELQALAQAAEQLAAAMDAASKDYHRTDTAAAGELRATAKVKQRG